MHIAKWNKSVWKGYCMIPIMLHSRKGKSTVSKKVSGCQASVGKGLIRWRRFLGQGNYFVWYCLTEDTWHYAFVGANTAQRVNLNLYKILENYLRHWGILEKNSDMTRESDYMTNIWNNHNVQESGWEEN